VKIGKNQLLNVDTSDKNISKKCIRIFDEEGDKKGIEFSVHVLKGCNQKEILANHLANTDSKGSETEKETFVDFGFSFEKDVDPNAALEFVKAQQQMLFAILESAIPGFEDIFNQFGSFEFLPGLVNKNVITVRVKGQAIIQQMVEGTLGGAYALLTALPNNQQLYFAIKSKYTFEDIFNGNFTLMQALKGYEIDLKIDLIRDYLRKIAAELNDTHLTNIVQIVTASTSLNLDLKMEAENLVPEHLQQKINLPCSIAKDMLGALVNQFLGEGSLVHKLKCVELFANTYGVNARVHLNCPGLLK